MSARCYNGALVDQYRLPVPELAGARNRVVHICERDTRESTSDYILVVIGEYDLAAALKRDAMLNQFEFSRVYGRVERNGACVIDHTTQRQNCAVSDGHDPGIVHDRGLIEHKVTRRERLGAYAVDRDRLPVA